MFSSRGIFIVYFFIINNHRLTNRWFYYEKSRFHWFKSDEKADGYEFIKGRLALTCVESN